MAVSELIRHKPEWMTKVFNEEITTKWVAEAVAGGARELDLKYVVKELQQVL